MGSRTFATASAVILSICHVISSLNVQYLRLLSSVLMFSTCVNFKLTEHCAAQRTFWQHTFNCFFQNHFWLVSKQLLKVSLFKTKDNQCERSTFCPSLCYQLQ